MLDQDISRQRYLPLWALAASLLIHALALLIPRSEPAGSQVSPRLEARLAPPAERARVAAPERRTTAPPARLASARKGKPAPRVLTAPAGERRRWSVAEKREMDDFLDQLADDARSVPPPTLAQRSLAMAREAGRQIERQAADEAATLEMRPDAPPPDPFSLEMYVDGLVRRLNRSAAYVRNDPRSKGVRNAAVQFRLNPDGSLKSFSVLNMGDQAAEIAFIRSVVERSIPFAPFPADLNRAARSLAMTICIIPGGGSGGFGFTRLDGRRGC